MKRIFSIPVLILVLLTLSCAKKEPAHRSTKASAEKPRAPSLFARPAFAYAGQPTKGASLSDIAERAVKSVVNISSTRMIRQRRGPSPFHGHPFFDQFFGQPGVPQEERAKSLGSGVIVSKDGIVLTNNHVVEHTQEIRVRLADNREMTAKLVGSDAKSDLAVLRLQGELKDIDPLPLGEASKLRLGEVVLAIGNPFGVGQTVTMGIVSATGRANMGIVDYEDFIQTDAAINPGNSGGALVNMRAELVGINTAILSRSGGYQGIGFAIPSDMAKPIMESLITHGKVMRGWLGVVIQDLNQELAQNLGVSAKQGVLISDVVPEGPAAKAGLQRADVITQINGQPTHSVAHLRNKIAVAGVDKTVQLTVIRKDKTLTVAVRLSALPSEAVATLDQDQGALGGLTLEPLDDAMRRQLRLPQRARGVVVKTITPGSAAQDAGLSEGDVILEINRQTVVNPLQFSTLYRRATGNVLLLIYRRGSTLYLLLEK